MSQPKILIQWNEASAADKATDKLLHHLGAVSEAICAGHKPSVESAWGSKGSFALGLVKYSQKYMRTALVSALPSREPLFHDLGVSHSKTQTAWLTLLWNQGKSSSEIT